MSAPPGLDRALCEIQKTASVINDEALRAQLLALVADLRRKHGMDPE